MTRPILTILSALLLAATFGSPVAAAPRSWSALQRTFSAEFPANQPGAFVLASRDGRIVHAQGFGLANLETPARLTGDGVVRIASLTKQFTAVAILALVQERKLSLDDRLETLLPDCPPAWRPISVRQLLSQTSGLSGDMGPIFADPMRDRTPDQLLDLYRTMPLASPPGSAWRYSNLNYWILGRVIELETGQGYADFVRRRVLTPAMAHTRYGSNLDVIPGRVSGYERPEGSGWRNARYFSATIGYSAGGFVSSPHDMAAWYGALGRGEILSPAILGLAFEDTKTSDGQPTGYGLGWYVSRIDGRLVVHHGGSTLGFGSYLYWVPAEGVMAAVFRNGSDDQGEPQTEARQLLDIVMAR